MPRPAEPSFREVLPSCYRHLLPAFFDAAWPSEPHASCDCCAMLPLPGEAPEPGRHFLPETKCCTYQPFLPNYAVGGLLGAEKTRGGLGRERILERLACGAGVVPAGIRPSARDAFRYRRLERFGASLEMRCPYYDAVGGGCSVWPFREADCTTWFCKLRHGKDGLAFWASLRSYLHRLERTLVRHGLRALGFSAEAIARAVELPDDEAAALQETSPEGEASRRALWGEWLGREVELYAACHARVLALDAPGLDRLGGEELAAERQRLEQALLQMLAPRLPARLRRNPRLQAARVPGGWLVTSYSPFDPLRVGDALWSALALFDGGTATAAVRERMRVANGIDVSEDLLARLVQLELLVPAG